ncbi:MAG: hypothetical protein OXQ94_01245 [Gemmatimonadota bacterium]|nr:hypothetical protein [Gemmatimonadota bacterium]MDE2870303.1 hypothetical protein [Gemmatimonadota bacterium]
MNVTLTDHLVCPRCGPPFGLVLLARDVRDRRVYEGEFGCPNCRDRFPVEGGFGDLRPPPRGVGAGEGGGGRRRRAASAGGIDVGEAALRLAAALGATSGPGLVVVSDGHRDEAAPLARLVRGIEVVVVGWGGRGLVGEGVSAFVTGPKLPLRDRVARGVVAEGEGGVGWWGECLRVVMPGGRIVITGATGEAREWVVTAGLVRLLDEGGVVVVGVAAPGTGPRMGRWVGRG